MRTTSRLTIRPVLRAVSLLASTTALVSGLFLSPAARAQDLTEITVALPVNLCLANWPFYIADQQGLFAAEGISVSLEGLNGSSAALQATIAGQAQVAASAPADFLAAVGAGAELTGFYSFYQYLPFALVVPEGSEITSVADLAGRTVGIASPGDGGAIFMRSVLSHAGIAEGSYEELAVGEGNTAASALTGGVVDAYSASFVEEIIFKGMGIGYTRLSADGYPATTGELLVADTAFFEANPDLIAGLGRALARATAAGLADRDLVVATCTAVAPQETEDMGFTTAVLDGVDPLFTLIDSAGGQYGFLDEAAWIAYRDLMVGIGLVREAASGATVSNTHVGAWNE